MIVIVMVDQPSIFDEWNIHPLERWRKVHIAYRACVIENCSKIIDVILLNIIALLIEVSIVEQQIRVLDSLRGVF